VIASVPDLLRLLVVPVLVWAAWRDLETRRVPNRTWTPIAALAVVLLAWDGAGALAAGGHELALFVVGTAISLLVVVPAAYLFWRFGAFGGADAKALIVLAVLFPTFPLYQVGGALFPLHATPTGAFALTILSNTVLVGACYPLWLVLHNAAAGRFTPLMAVGRLRGALEGPRSTARTPVGVPPRGARPRRPADVPPLAGGDARRPP
jgi:archaeal preflagellin peptidase FlaK